MIEQIEKFFDEHKINKEVISIPEFTRYTKLVDDIKPTELNYPTDKEVELTGKTKRFELIMLSYDQTLSAILKRDSVKPYAKEFIGLLNELVKDHEYKDRFTSVNELCIAGTYETFDKYLDDYKKKVSGMNIEQSTKESVAFEESKINITSNIEKEKIGRLQNEIEKERATRLKRSFKLGKNSKFYQILMKESPKRLAAMINLMKNPKLRVRMGQKINIQSLLENSPEELWTKISQLGKELNKDNKAPKKKGFKYYVSVVVHKFKVFQGKEVRNKELREAIKEINEILIGQDQQQDVNLNQGQHLIRKVKLLKQML